MGAKIDKVLRRAARALALVAVSNSPVAVNLTPEQRSRAVLNATAQALKRFKAQWNGLDPRGRSALKKKLKLLIKRTEHSLSEAVIS